MTKQSCIPDFSGHTLVIPDKTDVERDAVAKAWEEHGGDVIRVGRFWEPPKLIREKIRLYGNHIFCMVLAQKLNLELISPLDNLLLLLTEKWLRRNIGLCSLADAEQLEYPRFIKPLAPKLFTAGKYHSYTELLKECTQLENYTQLVHSDIVSIKAEVRSFVLGGQICDLSVYEGTADINEAKDFLSNFINKNSSKLPLTCVIDAGYIDGLGWAIIEANASWGAGLNGCDPLAAAMCIEKATKLSKVGEETC